MGEDAHVAAALAGELRGSFDRGGGDRAPLGSEEHAILRALRLYDVGTANGTSGASRLSSTRTRYQYSGKYAMSTPHPIR